MQQITSLKPVLSILQWVDTQRTWLNLSSVNTTLLAKVAFALCTTLLFSMTLINMPVDDFWRHMIAHSINYDYRTIFGETYPYSMSMWWPFEWVLGQLQQVASFDVSVFSVKALLWAVILYPYCLGHRRWPEHLVLLLCFGSLCLTYFTNLRPASFMSILLLNVFIVNANHYLSDTAKRAHLITVCTVLLSYHTFWVFYLFIFLLAPITIIIFSVIGAITWFVGTDGAWLPFTWDLMSVERYGVSISELEFQPLLILLTGGVICIILSPITHLQSVKHALFSKANIPILFAASLGVIEGSARWIYVSMFILLIGVVLSGVVLKENKYRSYAGLCAVLFGLTFMNLTHSPEATFPEFKTDISHHSVLSDDMLTMYKMLPHLNLSSASTIHIAPSMEIGFNDVDYIHLYAGAHQAACRQNDGPCYSPEELTQARCDYLRAKQVDFVVAEKLPPETNLCLTFVETSKSFSLWAVSPLDNPLLTTRSTQ